MTRIAIEGSGRYFSAVSIGRIVLGLAAITVAQACARDTAPPPTETAGAVPAPAHKFDHVIIVVLENENAAAVHKVPAMDSLAKRGVLLRNYYAVAHPSYPNYLALISGNTFIGSDPRARHDPDAYRALDMGDAQLLIDAPTILDGLAAKGLAWDAFAEDYPELSSSPARCDFRRQVGLYARKHFPFLSFAGFHAHRGWCRRVRNLRWFSKDSLAAYTFIAPNLVHDGHDAPLSTAVTWLRAFLQPVLADSAIMKRTLVVVTFDESANPISEMISGSQPNRVYTLLLGGMLSGHISDRTYSHFSLLQTIEDNFGSSRLAPGDVSPIADVWQ
jgi:hypothetical protein